MGRRLFRDGCEVDEVTTGCLMRLEYGGALLSYTLVHCLRELMLAKLIHRISWIIMRLPVTRNADGH